MRAGGGGLVGIWSIGEKYVDRRIVATFHVDAGVQITLAIHYIQKDWLVFPLLAHIV